MHSRAFIMKTVKDGKDETELVKNIQTALNNTGGSDWDESSIYEVLEAADYVSTQEENDFLDDLRWLEAAYGIKVETIDIDNEYIDNHRIGLIRRTEIDKLSVKLEQNFNARVAKARKIISKDNLSYIDIYNICESLNPKTEFYFGIDGCLENEVAFYTYYLNGIKKQKEVIIVIESYDYHC